MHRLLFAMFTLCLMAACSQPYQADDASQAEQVVIKSDSPQVILPTPHFPIRTKEDWLGVNDFLYQLQRPSAQRIGKTAFDLAVVSIAAAGSSPDVISMIQKTRKVGCH
jgi:hypothetical protein